MRGLRILLNVARQNGVAASTHGNVERWTWPPRVGQTIGEPDPFDEPFGLHRGLDAAGSFALPSRVAIFLNFLGQTRSRHAVILCDVSTRMRPIGTGSIGPLAECVSSKPLAHLKYRN